MRPLSNRLEVAHFSIADQADYLQQLLQQFDMPYDACCGLQVAVADLRRAAENLSVLAQEMDRELRHPEEKTTRRRGR